MKFIFPFVLAFKILFSCSESAVEFQHEFEKFDKKFNTSFIQVGEELVYEVKYLFFKLGQIKFTVVDKFIDNGKEFYRVRVKIDSYSVPFVDIHANFDAVFDSRFVAQRYYSEMNEKKYYQSVRYNFVEKSSFYVVEKNYQNFEYNTKGKRVDTVKVMTNYCDGPSLFYYARSNASVQKTMVLPTFIEGVKGITIINFGKKKTKIKIDALNRPIEAYEIDGKASYVGFFGLTGDFTGWISADEKAIPLKGKLKVIVGSVIVELKSWNFDWKPA
jgi:hypothetical protein